MKKTKKTKRVKITQTDIENVAALVYAVVMVSVFEQWGLLKRKNELKKNRTNN